MRLSRDARNYLLFGSMLFIVLEVLLALAIIWWPSFAEHTGVLKQLAAPLPMLAEQLNLIDMIGVPAYVVAQHFFKGCNTLGRSEEHTSELQSRRNLVCRLPLEKKKKTPNKQITSC